MNQIVAIFLGLLLLAGAGGLHEARAGELTLRLASANPASGLYALALEMADRVAGQATLAHRRLTVPVEPSPSTVAALRKLCAGAVSLALVPSAGVRDGLQAARCLKGANLRTLALTDPRLLVVLVRPDLAAMGFGQLVGARVGFIQFPSDSTQAIRALLGEAGLPLKAYTPSALRDEAEMLAQLRSGRLDAAIYAVPALGPLVREALARGEVRLLVPGKGDVVRLRQAAPYLALADVAGGDGQIYRTVQLSAVLLASAALDEGTVLALLRGLAPAPLSGQALPLPLHEGAVAYYQTTTSSQKAESE